MSEKCTYAPSFAFNIKELIEVLKPKHFRYLQPLIKILQMD